VLTRCATPGLTASQCVPANCTLHAQWFLFTRTCSVSQPWTTCDSTWAVSPWKCCSEAFHDQALMKWLQAGERPEAPQPPGLTVQLHPYQRQSLRFMLDNEIGEGGHRRHFWVPYNTPSGFTFWWSPVFQRPCKEVAPCPWGGFLAEEMVRISLPYTSETNVFRLLVMCCMWPHQQEFLVYGMQGCGKTVEVLALILANPAPPEVVSGTVTPDVLIQSR
jgi:SWI/SNF-related matrix-associated actin-dependent regulator of chromatin subfamily A3